MNIPRDAVGGALAGAQRTAGALLWVYHVPKQAFTYARRTFFIGYMGLVFVVEVAQGGQHRIGRRLAQPAQ